MAFKGAKGVIFYHNQSVRIALFDLFPDIGLSAAKFRIHQSWRDAALRRSFFERCAKDIGFDPLNPENWYRHKKKELITQYKGGTGVLEYYGRSVTRALLDLFPDIGLIKEKLRPTGPRKHLVSRKVAQITAKS
eukprot:Phypoly_transcript_20376.p1 GENE.Phypoly_transcript_20376~~Phypoly_transcript_20376.p1  ORF type:complete len:147 (+),score=20.00 Phypoly_transcript_20376:41-442(+)